MQRILTALADSSPDARKEAYFFAFVTFIFHLSFAQIDLIQMWHSRRSYERTRGQVSLSKSTLLGAPDINLKLFCALHYKALRRRDISAAGTKTGKEKTSLDIDSADLGKIVNLMQ